MLYAGLDDGLFINYNHFDPNNTFRESICLNCNTDNSADGQVNPVQKRHTFSTHRIVIYPVGVRLDDNCEYQTNSAGTAF